MQFPISIIAYPLFSGWRAECKNCGAYADSYNRNQLKPNGRYGENSIKEALDNLASSPNTYKVSGNSCKHEYGSYSPRVNCSIDYSNLSKINEPYRTEGCPKFPAITVGGIRLDVINAVGLTYNWSAYSQVQHSRETEALANIQQAGKNIPEIAQSFSEKPAKSQITISLKKVDQTITILNFIVWILIGLCIIYTVRTFIVNFFNI